MRALILALCLLLSPSLAVAQTAEYRTLELADGRALTGLVVESLAEGMLLKLEQGSVLVRYDQLAGIEVIDEAAATAAPDWTIAIAPMTGGSDELKGWLLDAARGVPAVKWLATKPWLEDAKACDGTVDCLTQKAAELEADYLLAPVFGSGRLMLKGVHLDSEVVTGEAALFLPEERSDAGPVLLGGVFTALGLRPNVDLMKAASAPAVAEPEPEPIPELEPEPEPVATAVPEPTPESKPVVTTAPRLRTSSRTRVLRRTTPSVQWSRNRGVSIALGFAPVPGLNSAYLGDPPGFIVSLTGTFALGALSVYTLGSTIRWKDPFIASTILVPYAINVLFNEISGAVGWNRLYGARTTVARRRVPVAGIAPLFAPGDRRPNGAALTLGAEF